MEATTTQGGTKMPSTYELCEHYLELQTAEDGTKYIETVVADGFPTLDEAVAFATLHMVDRPAGLRPWVGIIEVEDGVYESGFARGWVTSDGTLHDGDYENDPSLWGPFADKVAASVEQAKSEILADVANGTVPAEVTDFSTLHDYVDANEYGGLCDAGHAEMGMTPEEWQQWAADVQEAVHGWLANGGIAASLAGAAR